MRPVSIVVVALGLCACAGGQYADAFDQQSRGSARTGALELRWRRRLAEVTDLDHRPLARGAVAVDAARRVVFAGGVDSGFYALRSTDAALLWRFEGVGRFDGTPLLDDGTVFVGNADGALYALDAQRGAMRWRYATSAEIVNVPARIGDAVVFTSAGDTVYSVGRSDGALRWRYRRNAPGGISLSGHGGVAAWRGRVYAGFADGVVVCLDASDGSVVWEQDTSADLENIEERNEAHEAIDIDTTPVVMGDTVFVASFTAGVYALDALGGGRRWRLDDLLQVSALASDGRHLFAASAANGIVKLDPYDGRVIWARDLSTRALAQPVSLSHGLLAVPATDRGFFLLRASDGEVVDAVLPGRGFSAPPVAVGDAVYARSNGAVVYSFLLRDR